MNKTFYTVEYNAEADDTYDTYQEAEDQAKRCAGNNNSVYHVMQAVAKVQAPVPESIVTKLG